MNLTSYITVTFTAKLETLEVIKHMIELTTAFLGLKK